MLRKYLMIYLCCSLLLGVGLTAKPENAEACFCAANVTVQEEYDRKTAIFVGTVRNVEMTNRGFLSSSAAPVKVTFKVSEVWKGDLPSETTVYTVLSSVSCGYEGFKPGTEHIVFASGTPDRLETGMCDLTQPLSSAGEELAALGAGFPPANHDEKSSYNQIMLMFGVGLVIVVAAAAFMVSMKRRRNES